MMLPGPSCTGALVGVSRAITDFSYCCYLSDLAVDKMCQRKGVGKMLIAETHRCSFIFLPSSFRPLAVRAQTAWCAALTVLV